MKTQTAHLEHDRLSGLLRAPRRRGLTFLLVVCASFTLLFMGMSLRPLIYDEGLVLTAAMRVGAGQIPHRDFYANYGPAQFFALAGLFKVFGPSLLVERIYDLLIKALLVGTIFGLASSYCRKAMATAIVSLLWVFSLSDLTGTPVIPVCLLNIASSALILCAFEQRISKKRLLGAGILAGAAALFRYDTGVALFGIDTLVISIAIYSEVPPGRTRKFLKTWPFYMIGFSAVTLPPLLRYLHVATIHPIVHDILVYPGAHYHGGRSLPFPHIGLHTFENIQVYLPIAAIVIAIYRAAARQSGSLTNDPARSTDDRRVRGFLLTFGVLAFVMFFKGYVRMQIGQMYLCIIPSVLLIAVLFETRAYWSRLMAKAISALGLLSIFAVTSATIHQLKKSQVYSAGLLETHSPFHRAFPPETQAWCKTVNPLTRGLCFLPDSSGIETIEYVVNHTTQAQRLYVGLVEHQKIFANDNLIYFAAQRLPITHWSHFDPGLQNSLEIQSEMINEMQAEPLPYIVLDSEFEKYYEPNDSSKLSDVHILDTYIHDHYGLREQFGRLSVWQKRDVPPQ